MVSRGRPAGCFVPGLGAGVGGISCCLPQGVPDGRRRRRRRRNPAVTWSRSLGPRARGVHGGPSGPTSGPPDALVEAAAPGPDRAKRMTRRTARSLQRPASRYKRVQLLEQEDEVVRRAAAPLAPRLDMGGSHSDARRPDHVMQVGRRRLRAGSGSRWNCPEDHRDPSRASRRRDGGDDVWSVPRPGDSRAATCSGAAPRQPWWGRARCLGPAVLGFRRSGRALGVRSRGA